MQLILQQDLLGGWALLRETGQTGGKAPLRREQFLDQAQALAAFEKARDAQLKRGFQVMFAQGANAPAITSATRCPPRLICSQRPLDVA